LISTPLTFTG
jgi:hypothetical protein